MINFITNSWTNLSKDEAIRIAIAERNKANACKDLVLRKDLLEEIRKFEAFYGIGIEHETDKDNTGGMFEVVEKKTPSLRASIFDMSKAKKNR